MDALAKMQKFFPERFSGSEKDLPLFRYSSGKPIKREEIQHFLELSAIANGQNPIHMGSHSLRIGGATAMYHALGDLEIVKRFGRWASNAFHGYLWESNEQAKGVSQKMARDFSSLSTPS